MTVDHARECDEARGRPSLFLNAVERSLQGFFVALTAPVFFWGAALQRSGKSGFWAVCSGMMVIEGMCAVLTAR